VPIAEATGIIGSIGRWLLSEAARQHVAWHWKGLPAIPIAVNVSVVELRGDRFIDYFQRILDDYGIAPEVLQLELTETAVMDDIEHAITQLDELQQRGVTILLDDFGTGHSSLTYLARLPLTKVKIDKSFITNLGQSSANRTVTDAMVALAHSLGLDVVTEGIETEEVLDYVRALGCQEGQGFYLGKPMSGEAFETWYQNHLHYTASA
jgi:EAL domain-containing protein (putative c-di-GMP-specific phosphodiesterase class I)